MNYLPLMTEDEIRYVCSAIPLRELVLYFNQYPKDFAKVMPGFRASTLKSQEQVSGLLFRSRKQRFISSFIEKRLSRWIEEIGAAIKEKTRGGESREVALLQILPYCFFADNIGLYFKLIGEQYSEDFIVILSSSIKMIKGSDIERERIKSSLNARSSEVSRLKVDFEHVQSELQRTRQKLNERLDELKELKRTNADSEKLKGRIVAYEQEIYSMKQKSQEREGYIQKLRDDLSAVRDERQQLEKNMRAEFEKQEVERNAEREAASGPKCPKDILEFKDYLGYNFENLGVSTHSDYYLLLKDHLSEVLFQGKPVIISRGTAFSLMKCVSNTLIKTSSVPTFSFASHVTEKDIDIFLSQKSRIVCLDNFIGNYDESLLVICCDKHRNKIIFLTVSFDRTLQYVPEELMNYCHYLNLNRIEAFTGRNELTEDPSTVDEIETVTTTITPDTRWSKLLKDILEDVGVHGALTAYKSSLVANESNLCRVLAFDVLPYCVDVLKVAPFNASERLVKYAGDGGRCPYKDLFGRWFA